MVEPPHLGTRGVVGVITGFLDESGTHGGSQSTVMAGFVGGGDNWAHLEGRWNTLLLKHPEIRFIHGKELLPKRGAYFKWSEENYLALIEELSSIVHESNIYSVLCVLHNSDYQRYRELWRGSKYSPDSSYGMCFRACLKALADIVLQDTPGHRLSLILEDGHKNRHEAEEIFLSFKKHHTGHSWTVLGNIALAAKEDYGALQVADLHAYGSYHTFARDLRDDSDTARRISTGWNAITRGVAGNSITMLDKNALVPIAAAMKAAYRIHQESGKRESKHRPTDDE